MKPLSFLSIRRVFTGASPPAHTPSTPPRRLALLPAPLGQERWSVCRCRLAAVAVFGEHPWRWEGGRLSGGGSRPARAWERNREAGAGRLRLLCIPARPRRGERRGSAAPARHPGRTMVELIGFPGFPQNAVHR